MSVTIYTLPNCPNCNTLKGWLEKKKVEFKVAPLDTLNRTRFIMDDVFGSVPILETYDGLVLVGEDMFDGYDLLEDLIEVTIG